MRTALDLTPDQQATFGSEVGYAMRENPRLSFVDAHALVRDSWNLSCHHPRRRPIRAFKDGRVVPGAFECELCGSYVIPKGQGAQTEE